MPKDTFFNLPDEKRQNILDCAVNEFAEFGLQLGSINRIVAAAGIAKGSFYQYFADKTDIYEYIIDSLIAGQKLQIKEDLTHKVHEMPLFQFLRMMFRAQVHEFINQPKLIRIALDFWYLPIALQKRTYSKYDGAMLNYFIPFIEARQKAGELAPDIDVRMLGDMFLSLSMSFALELTSERGKNLSEGIADEIVDKMERILGGGIFAAKVE